MILEEESRNYDTIDTNKGHLHFTHRHYSLQLICYIKDILIIDKNIDEHVLMKLRIITLLVSTEPLTSCSLLHFRIFSSIMSSFHSHSMNTTVNMVFT